MLADKIKERIAAATVTVITEPGVSGLGVLVSGGLIITAAHCIKLDYDTATGAALGDTIIKEIETPMGALLRVSPVMVEPCADIAVLGPIGGGNHFEWLTKFDEFCDNTEPVELCRDWGAFDSGGALRVYFFTHKGKWVGGSARAYGEGLPSFYAGVDELIEGGTSGGPIVNDKGELVGVTSVCSTNPVLGTGACDGQCPRLPFALPIWVNERIHKAEEDQKGRRAYATNQENEEGLPGRCLRGR